MAQINRLQQLIEKLECKVRGRGEAGWGLPCTSTLARLVLGPLSVLTALVFSLGTVTELHPFIRPGLAKLLIPCRLQSPPSALSSADPPLASAWSMLI